MNYETPYKVFLYLEPSERFVVIKALVLCSLKCSVSREVGSVERPLDGQGNSNETCCPPPLQPQLTKPITAPATAALNETCYSPLHHIDSPVITETGVADLAPLTRCPLQQWSIMLHVEIYRIVRALAHPVIRALF